MMTDYNKYVVEQLILGYKNYMQYTNICELLYIFNV